jgi:hypothetical protein
MSTQNARSGSLVGGAILIGLGVLFLLGQIFNFSAWAYAWPLLLVGFGGLFFALMAAGGRPAAGLAIPGSILSAVGLVMLYQNLTGHWESWAYAWTIIVVAVGVGIFIAGAWTANHAQRRSGLRVATTGLVLFVLFGAFFELVIFDSGRLGARQYVFPVLLILAGVFMLLRRTIVRPGLARDESADPDATLPPPDEQGA